VVHRLLGSVFVVLAGFMLTACGSKKLELRTDPEPLTKRLNLPKSIQSVRWVSVSPINDTGGVPGRSDFYDVYAYIQMGADGWQALDASAGGHGAQAAIDIPQAVAEVIVPKDAKGTFQQSAAGRHAEGASYNTASLATSDKTEVNKALRVGDALLIQMRVY
jgi:hypothetical protein